MNNKTRKKKTFPSLSIHAPYSHRRRRLTQIPRRFTFSIRRYLRRRRTRRISAVTAVPSFRISLRTSTSNYNRFCYPLLLPSIFAAGYSVSGESLSEEDVRTIVNIAHRRSSSFIVLFEPNWRNSVSLAIGLERGFSGFVETD
ncbi:hypothetical protein RIF29_17845 [Crotalaria pallida]|uniref:Uncharacterized protein n=1 Tax=Crotalaria pallida TaxID=3830 RepID=A0AAN9IGU0_CROPI